MGRKIPGKKHRHVVDPEKQRAKRLESQKNKINNPPPNPNEQEVPRSVLKIMELKKACNVKLYKKKSKRRRLKEKQRKSETLSVKRFLDKDKAQPGMKKAEKFIPNLVQRPRETPENFLTRVNFMTQNIIKEQQFEDKFKVSIKKDPVTGKVLKVEKNKSLKGKKSSKKSLLEKRKEKRINKLKENEFRDFNELKDKVEFGEVVHRPPDKLKLKKSSKTAASVKDNKYKNLLLQDILQNKQQSGDKFQQEKLEKERQFIVNAYRERKKLHKL